MTTDNTTPSTGSEYDIKDIGENKFDIVRNDGRIMATVIGKLPARYIATCLNKLSAIDTASEVDVSDEAIKIAAYKYSHWHETVKSYTHGMNTMRNALLPQLAKAKEEVRVEKNKYSNLSEVKHWLEADYDKCSTDLAASQAEVEKAKWLNDVLEKLRNSEFNYRIESESDVEVHVCLVDRSVYPRLWVDNQIEGNPVLAETPDNILDRLSPLAEKDWVKKFSANTTIEAVKLLCDFVHYEYPESTFGRWYDQFRK